MALYFESVNELKFYNLEARSLVSPEVKTASIHLLSEPLEFPV